MVTMIALGICVLFLVMVKVAWPCYILYAS